MTKEEPTGKVSAIVLEIRRLQVASLFESSLLLRLLDPKLTQAESIALVRAGLLDTETILKTGESIIPGPQNLTFEDLCSILHLQPRQALYYTKAALGSLHSAEELVKFAHGEFNITASEKELILEDRNRRLLLRGENSKRARLKRKRLT